MTGQVRIDHAVTSGTFALDGETFRVDNNIWVVGDDDECVVIDAPHSVEDILKVVGDRRVRAIVCTHAHDDHVRVAPDLSAAVNAPILLHPEDKPLWNLTHTDRRWTSDLVDGQHIGVAGTRLLVLHTPGHAPGAVCLYAPDLDCVFTGDTLFDGGPGATGRSFSDLPTLEESIRAKLFALPADTTVHTGHGNSTTIGKERAQMAAENAGRRVRMMRLPGEECVRAVDGNPSASRLSAKPRAQPSRHNPFARSPVERSRWHVVAPFARYDPSTEFTMLMPTSTIHAKEMGTLTTACGLRSDSWFKFWAEEFPMPGTEICQECWHVAQSTPRR